MAGTGAGRRDVAFSYLLPALFGLAGLLLNLHITSRYGIGLFTDSANYLSAARSLVAGRGLLCFDGTPYTSWPPLYPALLGLLELLGRDVIAWARFLHALVMGAIAFSSFFLLRRALKSRVMVLAGSALVATSPTLQFVSGQMLSDAVFCLLTLLFVLAVSRLLDRPSGSRTALCAALGALLCLQRYVGVFVVLAGAAVMLVWLPGKRGKRLFRTGGLLLASFVPLGAWLARNYALTSSLTGSRTPATQTFFNKLGMTLNVLGNWYYPVIDDPGLGLVAGTLFAAALVAGAVLGLRDAKRDKTAGASLLRVSAVTAGCYVLALIAVSSLVAFDQLSPRLLAPAFVPVVVLVLGGIQALGLRGRAAEKRNQPGVLAPALAMLIALYPLSLTVRTTRIWNNTGIGVYARAARLSPLLNWLRRNPPEGRMLSNDPAVVYLFLGRETRLTPRRTQYPEAMYRDGEIGRGDYIVWFAGSDRPYLYSAEELNHLLPLEVVHAARDGGVLKVK